MLTLVSIVVVIITVTTQKKCFECIKKRQKSHSTHINSEDFYDEISLKAVINEYERAKVYKLENEKILFDRNDGTSNF